MKNTKGMKTTKSRDDHESASEMSKHAPKMRMSCVRIRAVKNGYVGTCEMESEDGMPMMGRSEEHVLANKDAAVEFVKKNLKDRQS